MKCLCGCGKEVDASKSRGERKMFYADACKLRYNRKKKRIVSVSGDTGPIMRYPGAKWSRAEWVIKHLPTFRTYVDPFFGSGAIYFSLPSMPEYAVLNDKSKRVVNLFEILRTRAPELCSMIELTPWARDEYDASDDLTGDPLEDARRFLIRCWQAHGTRLNGKTGWRNRGSAAGGLTYSLWNKLPERLWSVVEKLKCAEIENRDALEIIERFSDQSDCLLYVDPPYVLSTRSGAMYEHEMEDSEHVTLLRALRKHVGPVVLSGYDSALYEQEIGDWQKVTTQALAESGQKRTECLWLNPCVVASRQASLF